jgi:hypothetical protein
VQDGGLGDALGHRDRGLAEDAERCCGIDPADAVLLEQFSDGCLTEARCLGRGRRHGPQREHPIGCNVVAHLKQLWVITPKLLANAVAQAHALLLQLLRHSEPLSQAGLHP